MLEYAVHTDSFPGLPRPLHRVLIAIAPDRAHFREWIGPGAPEWGSAIAFPESRRVVMQGHTAGSDAGDPRMTLRHELAHLALNEYLEDQAPRWFDEGYASYAAREWNREDALTTNFALALRGMPAFDLLESQFSGPTTVVQAAYALSYRAVVELAELDPEHGLTQFFRAWKETGSLDRAMRSAYGMTLSDFEKRWQSRTPRRYGGLAVFGDLSLAVLVMLVLFAPLFVARRRRDRRRMLALRAADAAADAAARESALDALARPRSGGEREDDHLEGQGEGP